MKLEITDWNEQEIIISNRFIIMRDCGIVYDTIKGKDIPKEIFEIRDLCIKENLVSSIDKI